MNLALLWITVPGAVLVVLSDAWVAFRLLRMPAQQARVLWGGVYERAPFVRWVGTYVTSSFACVSTFLLFLALEPPDTSSIILFACLNVCYVCIGVGILREDSGTVVRCLDICVALFVFLFWYTLLVFRLDRGPASPALLLATHLANFIAVVHALVMERWVWYRGWLACLQDKCLEAMYNEAMYNTAFL
ncbi:MAG: hypothetical protein WCP53_00115 [Verrucomicrobiota bacterium]